MNKKSSAAICTALIPLLGVCFFTSCKKSVNYAEYVSENRKQVYLCKEDDYELKIFCLDRETPYCADGVKGNVVSVCEVYYKCGGNPAQVAIELEELGGEMNYMSVTNSFYLSFSATLEEKDELNAKITVDGKTTTCTAKNVFEINAIDWQTALKCVSEYDSEKFDGLTQGQSFLGEIGVRLIYDDGCYYYVSVCDRQKLVKAYLVDGKSGKIITERESVTQ